MAKNLLASAGDAELIPGWGTKISHGMGQLSPCPEIIEPVHSGETIKSTHTHIHTHTHTSATHSLADMPWSPDTQ